jgi:hypothetical protein
MTWLTIGVIEPGFNWTEFGIPVLGSTVIRVSHTYNQKPNGPALIRMNWYDGYFGTRRIYASQSKRVIEMRVPPLLANQGVVSWYPAIRLGYRTRPHENDNWTVLIEELIGSGSTATDGDIDRQLDELLTDVERIEQKIDRQAPNNPMVADQLPNGLDNTP